MASAARSSQAEAALVDRLKSGDNAAYEELVRNYGGRLLATARRLLPDENDARDALQSAFVSAFQAIRTFAGDAALGTWLHRIVVNAALMKLRSRRRRPEQSIDALLPGFLDDGHQAHPAGRWRETSEQAAARAETRDLVRARIMELPETYRDVLLLRDIEELDTAETAALLDISPNAVKTRLHRARQALRTLLDPLMRGGVL